MKRMVLFAMLALVVGVSPAMAEGTYTILEDVGQSFFGHYPTVSHDGSMIMANSNMYYSEGTGWITQDEGSFSHIAGGGLKVIGTKMDDAIGFNVGAIWDPVTGWSFMDVAPEGESCDSGLMSGYAGNFDGNLATGLQWVANCKAECFFYEEGVGTMVMGREENSSSRGTDMSDDGTTIGGFAQPEGGGARRAAVWTVGEDGWEYILPDIEVSEVMGVDSFGDQFTGQAYDPEAFTSTAFYYSEESGYVNIGMLPSDPVNGSYGSAVADNGSVVGTNSNPFWGYPTAFIWTPEDGLMDFGDFLDMNDVAYPEGTHFYGATDISADGNTIVGGSVAPDAFFIDAFIVVLGDIVSIEGGDEIAADLPTFETRLAGAHPNPFNPMTTVYFSLASEQQVKLSIFDLAGKRVAELANDVFAAGEHPVIWNGKDVSGRDVSSGTYVVYMETVDAVRSSKMTLVR